MPLTMFRSTTIRNKTSGTAYLQAIFLSGISFTDPDDSKNVRGREVTIFLFFSTTSDRSQAFRYLFATLHMAWLTHIFNRTSCNYHAASPSDLPPYWITFDWLMKECSFLFVYLTIFFCVFYYNNLTEETGEFELASNFDSVKLSQSQIPLLKFHWWKYCLNLQLLNIDLSWIYTSMF